MAYCGRQGVREGSGSRFLMRLQQNFQPEIQSFEGLTEAGGSTSKITHVTVCREFHMSCLQGVSISHCLLAGGSVPHQIGPLHRAF